MLLLPAAAAGGDSFSPPAGAKAWIATWETNQGRFHLTSITTCKPADQFNPPVCGLRGTWEPPGGSATDIHGTVFLGDKYKGELFQGCYDMPNLAPGEHCTIDTGGAISLERMGTRITHGFWKACGISNPCQSHHPILGKKVAGGGSTGGKVVHFRVVVDGFPDKPAEKDLPPDLTGVEIASEDASLSETSSGGFVPHGSLKVNLTYVNPVVEPHVQETSFTIDLEGRAASYVDDADQRMIRMTGMIEDSDDSNCLDNKVVLIRLRHKRTRWALGLNGECLSDKTIVWLNHRIKRASISKAEPA